MTDETIYQPGVLDTPELPVKVPEAQAHRGRIVGIEQETSDKGSTAMVFALESIDTGRQDDYRLWLPTAFVEDIHVNPAELPEEEGNNQRLQYTIGVSNSDKTATLQALRQIAADAGRALDGVEAPAGFDDFVALHSQLLSGVELIYTLACDRKPTDPRFKNVLRVRGFYPMDAVSNPKMFKRYKKAWNGEV